MTFFFENSLAVQHFSAWLMLLLDVTVKTTIILSVSAMLLKFLKGKSAALRHLVLILALVSVLVLPILSWVMPAWQVSILPRLAPVPLANIMSALFSGAKKTAISSVPASQHQLTIEPNNLFTNLHFSTIAMLCWLTGLLLLTSRLSFGVFSVIRIRRRASQDVDDGLMHLAQEIKRQLGIRQTVTLLMSHEVMMPMACGLLQPAILLPLTAQFWSRACCEAVLRHELAHIKRYDCQSQTLAQALCALYWFHPLVWWAARQMRIERELACDDQVLGSGTRASDYAHHLLEIVNRFNKRAALASAGFACSQLEVRVRLILDPDINRRHLNRASVSLISLLMGCFLMILAAIEPRRAVAFTSNFAVIPEVRALSATTSSVAGTNSKSETWRNSIRKVTRLPVVATGAKARANQLIAAATEQTFAGVAVSSSSSSRSSSQSTSAITPRVMIYEITGTEMTVTHGSDRGFGLGSGQGLGRGPN